MHPANGTTRRPSRGAAPLLLLLTCSCHLSWLADPEVHLTEGTRVEVQGRIDDPDHAEQIIEKPFSDDLEVRGPLVVQPGTDPVLLGFPLRFDDDTEFEDQDRNELESPPLIDGQWVKIRGRHEAGVLKVRKLRLQKARKDWQVEGVVSQVEGQIPSTETAGFMVSPFDFTTDRKTDVALTDPQREWDEFLSSGPLGRRASKEEKFIPFTVPLTERSRLGAQLETSANRRVNFNLNEDRDQDEDNFRNRFRLAFIHRFAAGSILGEDSIFYADANTTLTNRNRQGSENEKDLRTQFGEVFAFLPDFGLKSLHLQVGRQDFEERREWLYDEILDGARLTYEITENLQIEGSASFTPRLLTYRSDSMRTRNLLGVLTWKATEDWILTAYVLDRRSRPTEEFSPFHYGLRSYRKPDAGRLSHWLELSVADGLIDNQRLRGFAYDAGGTYVADVPLEPSLTVGLARATGDDNPGSTSRTFRQTGLQDNNNRWNGVTSFRYYGEIVDPELSNLTIVTGGIGLRPTRRSSIDLAFHSYRQVEPVAGSLLSNLRTQAGGTRRYIGKELDVILGYRQRRLSVEVIGGVFWPGSAPVQTDRALLGAAQVRLKF